MKTIQRVCFLLFCACVLLSGSLTTAFSAETNTQFVNLRGRVELGNKPLPAAQVSLWVTTGAEAPQRVVRGARAATARSVS